MKRNCLLLASAVTAAAGWAALPATAGDYQDQSAEVMSAAESGPVVEAIDAIRDANEPSEVVQAYARGAAVDPDNIELAAAYLRRMVEFHVPEMAAAQAERLVRRDPNNGLAWAVAADADAARGRMTAALERIVTAVQRSRDEPFVQEAAGHLLAWYDSKANRSDFPESLRRAVEDVRTDLKDGSAFKDAYREARDFYQNRGATTTYAPPPAGTEEPVYAPPEPTYPPYYGPDYGLYAAPLYPTYVPYGFYGYPSYLYSDVVIVANGHQHDRFRHHRFTGFVHDFVHRRDRDWRHGVGVGFGDGGPRDFARNGPVDRMPRVGIDNRVTGPDRSVITGPGPALRLPTINGPRTTDNPRVFGSLRPVGRSPASPLPSRTPPALRPVTVPRSAPMPSISRPQVTRSAAPAPSFSRPGVTRYSMPSRGFAPAPARSGAATGGFQGGRSFGTRR